MKKISFIFTFLTILFAFSYISFADDFYYDGTPQYNPYNGYTVMSLPPPPPMSQVPFYVRDDYDDYVEDYYECILGYEHKGFVCRYWRKYAEKHGFYQKTTPVQNSSAVNNQNPVPNINTGDNVNTNNSQPAPVTNQYNQVTPYTPQH